MIPTGFSFNMDGTAIYMTIGLLFMVHAMNVQLSGAIHALLVMLFASKLASPGAGS